LQDYIRHGKPIKKNQFFKVNTKIDFEKCFLKAFKKMQKSEKKVVKKEPATMSAAEFFESLGIDKDKKCKHGLPFFSCMACSH
jgi:hypothetical protein